MNIKLKIPSEPLDVKSFILRFHDHTDSNSNIRWDSLSVWYGNKLQKYLWNEWKGDLVQQGFTWQKFMKLIKHRTDKAILWSLADISWSDFVGEVFLLLESPLAKRIIEK